MDKSKFNSIYSQLETHFMWIRNQHMRNLFSDDPARFDHFSIHTNGLLLDFSKNQINQKTIDLLLQLTHATHLSDWREKMFSGAKINHTEDRAALHTALRNRNNTPVLVDGIDIMPNINQVLDQMKLFCLRLRNGDWLGYNGKKIKSIVNIGIGGSDLGPKFAVNALQPYCHKQLDFYFVSNVDSEYWHEILQKIHADTTLFIISSKTFTTTETINNARSARQWFLTKVGSDLAIAKHFVAVSTNRKLVVEFGIDPLNMFDIWNWVGGRYSLWSAIGLSIMLAIGYDRFIELLDGAYSMDQHFINAPTEKNMPIILALLSYWYSTFFLSTSHAVLPYDHLLSNLPEYLQQLHMESNGKSVDRDGKKTNYPTSQIVWGHNGINGQHAFYQLLHQGTHFITADFIIALKTQHNLDQHRDTLYANCLAQTEALMYGRTATEACQFLIHHEVDKNTANKLAPYMALDGNHPSNTIILDTINPFNLGALVALYEHKVFVHGILLNINSFDQWGVEFGKIMSKEILLQLSNTEPTCHDSSTNALIKLYRSKCINDST